MSNYTQQDAYEAVWDLWTAFMVTGQDEPVPAYETVDPGSTGLAMPRPERTYCEIKFSTPPAPISGIGYRHEGGVAYYDGAVEFVTTFSVYGPGGLDVLGKFLDALLLPSSAGRLLALGLGFAGRLSDPANRTSPLETHFEARATVDLRWTAVRTLQETQALIETAEVELELKRGGAVLHSETIETE